MPSSARRSASKKRNPLNDVNTADDVTSSGRKTTRTSARKARVRQTGENSVEADVSMVSAATAGSAQMAELRELDSSAMSVASSASAGSGADGDQTASLADLAKLMQSPGDGESGAVNSRRQTADPAAMNELNAMFASGSDDDDEDDAAAGGGAKADVSTFSSPVPAASGKAPTPKPLKSCISARKKTVGRSVRKGVRFGSPDAAEFHKDMATSSVTPLPKAFSRQRYQMTSPESQAQAVRAETDENSRILAELADDDEDEADVSVSSKVTGSARRQSMARSNSKKSKGKGIPRSAAEELESKKKMRRSPRLAKGGAGTAARASGAADASTTNNSTASDFEDELRALAPLPSPMDARRGSTMPNLHILNHVDNQYNGDESVVPSAPGTANKTANDTEYSQNFDEMSMEEDEDDAAPVADTTSRRLSLSSVGSEMSGTDMTVPLQSLQDLAKKATGASAASPTRPGRKAAPGSGGGDEDASVEYSQDFDSTWSPGSINAKGARAAAENDDDDDDDDDAEDRTVELPQLQTLIAKSAATDANATAAKAFPQQPDLSHLQQFSVQPAGAGGADDSSFATEGAANDDDEAEKTVELAPLQALIQGATAGKGATATTVAAAAAAGDLSEEEDEGEEEDDAAAGNTVPLGTLADLVQQAAAAAPGTPVAAGRVAAAAGVCVSYPTDSPYPGERSSMFTPATTPGGADASAEPMPVAEFVSAMQVDFAAATTAAAATPGAQLLPDAGALSAEAAKAWTPALEFLTNRLCAETEEVEQLVRTVEEDLSATNPPMLRSFRGQQHTGSAAAAASTPLAADVAALLAASRAEAELEWLRSYEKGLVAQVAQGQDAVAADVAAEAAEYQQLASEIDELTVGGGGSGSSGSSGTASDQVSQNTAVEQEQAALIRAYEQQIAALDAELQQTTAAAVQAQARATDAAEALATQSADAFAAASAAGVAVGARGHQQHQQRHQDFVAKYQELQRVCGWRLASTAPCSGTDCINGTAHTFAYAAASTRALRRAALPQLEVRVAASGAVSSIQFKAAAAAASAAGGGGLGAPAPTLAAFWNRACPPMRPVGCTLATVAEHVAAFDLVCARAAMLLEEVVALQAAAATQQGSLVRWVGGGAAGPAAMELLMRFSSHSGFRGPASQFQVTLRLGDIVADGAESVAAGGGAAVAAHCDVKCIFGAVGEAAVRKAVRDACDEQAHAFGCLTRVHDGLRLLVTRSRC